MGGWDECLLAIVSSVKDIDIISYMSWSVRDANDADE
jgi:hypothetical protein